MLDFLPLKASEQEHTTVLGQVENSIQIRSSLPLHLHHPKHTIEAARKNFHAIIITTDETHINNRPNNAS